jgi:hypothetical protein
VTTLRSQPQLSAECRLVEPVDVRDPRFISPGMGVFGGESLSVISPDFIMHAAEVTFRITASDAFGQARSARLPSFRIRSRSP